MGPQAASPRFPFTNCCRADQGPGHDLSGKVAFVGESASVLLTSATQTDSYPTVFSTSEGANLSGAEIGATAFANLLTNQTLHAYESGHIAADTPGVWLARRVSDAVASRRAGHGDGVRPRDRRRRMLAQWLFTRHSLLVPLACRC